MRYTIVLALLLPTLVFGQPPAGYYDSAAGLTGDAMRAALKDIIDGHSVVGNGTLWGAFSQTDRKANSKVWDIYSDVPDGTPPYEFTFVTDQCGQYNGEGDCFNREHTFPESWFNGAPPMSTDLFHLYPTDGWVNQQRGNLAYGEVGSPTWTSQNGSRIGPCDFPGCTGTVFEPIDAYKGDLARGYFYLLTRYYGTTSGWSSPMLQSGEFLPWSEALLLAWNEADPVSEKEEARNNKIFLSLQGNRNPYIDHPEWVQRIWGSTASVNELLTSRIIIRSVANGMEVIRPSTGMAEVRLFDTHGALVASRSFSGTTAILELTVPTGLYVVVLDAPEGRHVQRLVR
ncbi:MAG: endonuclease [Flavobacteriales bacterium]|jgi:endonuclease I|nr:endonuclease [Flavobacteriales bacterium]MBK6552067.1 endonuclease [Flavobacteriales bacterium]MBK6883105.1 endonuclease [Flavobacteriales bacterium]MBK7103141.1 endonuclease [Flavobacteriales bacterium]MBK7112883.1 endonuclease [Flavobacteriales bacterium]